MIRNFYDFQDVSSTMTLVALSSTGNLMDFFLKMLQVIFVTIHGLHCRFSFKIMFPFTKKTNFKKSDIFASTNYT